MRKYEPIWTALKDKSKVILAVPKQAQYRVKKGVLKERNNDIAFKFLLSENSQKARLKFTYNQSRIVIELIKSIGLDAL